MTSKTIAFWSATIVTLGIAACGGEKAASQADQSTAPASQSALSDTAAAPAAQPATATALATTPLSRDALMGVISETTIEPGPCPFLSEETALATAKTNHELIRREVSNEVCLWSKNAGFSVRVAIAPLATATPLKDRAYNIDTPPVLKPHPGPGNNAVILYDTAWDKELAYAMGFEQDGKLIEIFVTGMETDTARLTATAEEVAAKLPTAPTIEAQSREIVPALDYCDIWSDESIGALINAAPDSGLHSAQYGSAGCKWSSGYGSDAKSVTLARYKQGDTNLDRMLEMGGETLASPGDRAVILTRAPSDGYPGDTAMWAEVDGQQFNLTLTGTIDDHAARTKTLMENLFSRF